MNFVLSAIAPDTMVAVVAQNTKLNTKLDQSVDAKLVNGPFPKPTHPINPLATSLPHKTVSYTHLTLPTNSLV